MNFSGESYWLFDVVLCRTESRLYKKLNTVISANRETDLISLPWAQPDLLKFGWIPQFFDE